MRKSRFDILQKHVRKKWNDLTMRSKYQVINSYHSHLNSSSLQICVNPDCEDPGHCSCCPPDVPQGFLAVYVGIEKKRFVIPALHLNHPVFKMLLEKAEEEYGFQQEGGLTIPCEGLLFEHILWLIDNNDSVSLEVGTTDLGNDSSEKSRLIVQRISTGG
eukprot:c21916_g1_i1 orf=273-752(+)